MCYPVTYGSRFCETHDQTADPACTKDPPNPQYCGESWCYVDVNKCKTSTEIMARSDLFSELNLFYSYSTCNSSGTEWNNYYNIISPLNGRILKAAIPESWKPFHYKRLASGETANSSSPEYYNETIPFQGLVIDYVNSIINFSNSIEGIDYTFRSKGSDSLYPSNEFTSAVSDVSLGVADLAVALFWVTSERLRLTAFTTVLEMDQIILVVKKPTVNNSFGFQTKKLLQPFEPRLWCVLIASIVMTAILAVWFSKAWVKLKKDWKKSNWKKASFRRRFLLCLRLIVDSVLENGMFFFGASVEQDPGASLPHKLLMFGFAFLILITISAYVANLAAFLTRSGYEFIDTMEKANEKRIAICANSVLKSELERAWPTTNFSYSDHYNYDKQLESYDASNCSAVAVSFMESRVDTHFQEELCYRDLVYTNAIILEVPTAFPINHDLDAGFSYMLADAKKKGHKSFRQFVDEFVDKQPPSCGLTIVEQDDDNLRPLTLANMAFAFMFFFLFAILAATLQLFSKKSSRADKFIGRVSRLPHRSSSTDNIKCSHKFVKNDCTGRSSTNYVERGRRDDDVDRQVLHVRVEDDCDVVADFVPDRDESGSAKGDVTHNINKCSFPLRAVNEIASSQDLPGDREFEQLIENMVKAAKAIEGYHNDSSNTKDHWA